MYDELAIKLQPRVSALRIIIVAFAVTVLGYLAAAILARVTGKLESPTEFESLLRWIAIGSAPVAFLASRVLSAAHVSKARRQLSAGELVIALDASKTDQQQAFLADMGDAGKLSFVYHTQAIIASAVLEGAGFFCVTAYYLTGSLASFALSLALVSAIIAMYPSAAGVAEWIELQLRLSDEEQRRLDHQRRAALRE